MKDELRINGKDAYTTWGISMDNNALSELMTPSSNKTFIENESRLEHGKRVVRQDTDELLGLEQKLNEMELSEKDRKVVDDYTACMESKQDRMGYLLYEAGMKDARRKMRIRKAVCRISFAAAVAAILVIWHEKTLDKLQEILHMLHWEMDEDEQE